MSWLHWDVEGRLTALYIIFKALCFPKQLLLHCYHLLSTSDGYPKELVHALIADEYCEQSEFMIRVAA